MTEPSTATWARVCGAAAVAPGAVVAVDGADAEVVVWRTSDGRLCAMDARCPHMWSHLAFEGVVDGDELVCTAHFWRFDVDGRGTKLAVNGRRDPKADVRSFPVREDGGSIWVALPPQPA